MIKKFNLNKKLFKKELFFILASLVLAFVIYGAGIIGDPGIIPPTTDNPYGSYGFTSDEPAGFPSNGSPTSSLNLPIVDNDEIVNYFPAVIEENNYGIFNNLTSNSYDNYFNSSVVPVYNPGQISSTDTADFIFRQPFDLVNLFGGGYLPYVDFYYSSDTCQYLPCPQPPQPEGP